MVVAPMAALELVGLSGYSSRHVSQLSGGQQQRVALARAMALEPRILLFDEPLSNLDAKLREKMRFELRQIQQRLGIASVYVTHDQQEAMVIADRIVLMHNGAIEQIGAPEDLYHRPRTRFAAEFVGLANIHRGMARDGEVRIGGGPTLKWRIRRAVRSTSSSAPNRFGSPGRVRKTPPMSCRPG